MTEFLVIGGGIAGLSAGARLSEFGRVTVLERERSLGHHASGRSAALFEQNYGKPSTVALNTASRAFHEDAGVLSPRGIMLVAAAADEARFEADSAAMDLPEIDLDRARELLPILNPDHVTRAAHDADAWDIDTHGLLSLFASQIQRAGGQVLTQGEVTGVNRTRKGWELRTAKHGVLGGAVLVNAAGAWVDEIARMAGIAPLGFTPLRRSMARIAAPEGAEVGAWPMVFGAGEDWYMKPDAGALIVSPAEEDPSDPMDAWADDMVLAEGLARYEAHVTAPVERMLANWAGLRTFAPDRELVLGPDPTDPAFVWCAGQGGYGFQSAPAASAFLADAVAGRAPAIGEEVAARLRPDRFR